MTAFDAVVFDLDNTLSRSEQAAETIYEGAFEHAGVDPVGVPGDLWSALEGPPPTENEAAFLADGFARVLDQYGVDVDPDALAAGFLEIVDHSAVSFVDGAQQALRAARDNGAVGLLTNGPARRQQPKLRTLELESAFDTVVFAGDLAHRKPHPFPFEQTLAELDTGADRTLYVGDSLQYDVAGAHAAGWPVAWYRDGETDAGEHDPEFVLDSVGELAGVLEGDP